MHLQGIDICVIEQDARQRHLLAGQLRDAGYKVIEAPDGELALRQIYEHRPRVLIADVELPKLGGVKVCRVIRADPTLDGTYIILSSSRHEEGRKHKALNAGADDFIGKPFDISELKARIRNGMRFHRLQERLRRAALTDGLTGLWNYSQFREMLDREFQRARRYGENLAILMIDLDHFKAVNDSYGHEAGNAVLKLVAKHLRGTARDSDIVARYGGEEFAIVCPHTNLEDAYELAERIRNSLPDSVRLNAHPRLCVHASIGVAGTQDPRATSISALINLGDQALYHGKHNGRDQVTSCGKLSDVLAPSEVRVDEVHRMQKEIVALNMRTKEICLQSIWALIQALEERDGYSASHSRNVMHYTRWLVTADGWPEPMQEAAANAAMLHDLGTIGVSDSVLFKKGALSEDEAALVKQVPLITCKILEPLRVFDSEIVMIRHLRERFDGAGYPDRLAGENIPIGSRLIAVAEAFDSLTCDRSHHEAHSIDETIEILQADVGTKFDPHFFELLYGTIMHNRARWELQVERARAHVPREYAIATDH